MALLVETDPLILLGGLDGQMFLPPPGSTAPPWVYTCLLPWNLTFAGFAPKGQWEGVGLPHGLPDQKSCCAPYG